MNLVKIQSAAENDFIWQLVKDEDAYISWIGLSKRSNGEWMWQVGGALNYKNWASGQPDDKEISMNTRNGQWHGNAGKCHFLCKM